MLSCLLSPTTSFFTSHTETKNISNIFSMSCILETNKKIGGFFKIVDMGDKLVVGIYLRIRIEKSYPWRGLGRALKCFLVQVGKKINLPYCKSFITGIRGKG